MFEIETKLFPVLNGSEVLASYRLETSDWNSISSILNHDEYGFKDFTFNDGDTIIDMGAHIGGEALYFLTLARRLNYAYEPLPENVKLLKKNIQQNPNIMNVKIFQQAVGGENKKEVGILYGDINTEAGKCHHFIGSISNSPYKGIDKQVNNQIMVEQVTLEKIFEDNKIEHCKLIKMDIEGSEIEILKITPKEILEKIDWIIGEHHNIKRKDLFDLTKGVFTDEHCEFQNDDNIGHFRFKNKRLCH